MICWIKFFISQIITFGLPLFHLQARQKHVDEDVMKSGEQTAKSKMENMRPAPWSGSFASCVRGKIHFCMGGGSKEGGVEGGVVFKWCMHPRRINETSIVFFFVMHHYEVVNLSARRISAHCRSSLEASSSSWRGAVGTHTVRGPTSPVSLQLLLTVWRFGVVLMECLATAMKKIVSWLFFHFFSWGNPEKQINYLFSRGLQGALQHL